MRSLFQIFIAFLALLIFTFPATAEIPAPENVAAPPSTAQKTASGLAYVNIKQGSGKQSPSENALVTVHYTGWQTDGTMFDSSVVRGQTISFSLQQVIAGWTEGVQLMVVGDKTRFWIPEDLAYKGRAGAPQGMLVFDIELISFQELPKAKGAAPSNAQNIGSGVKKEILTKGQDPVVGQNSMVSAHLTIWDSQGKLINSSQQSGQPLSIPMNQMEPEILQLFVGMKKGEKSHYWTLLNGLGQVQIEVLEITELPAAPENRTPPPDAITTASGLAYKVLTKGNGLKHPTATSTVQAHYTGWLTDGTMFDSSVMRGQPATFPLNQVISGWTEVVQLMKKGDKFRVWIPENLAYQGQPGAPEGMLIFDIELIEITAE